MKQRILKKQNARTWRRLRRLSRRLRDSHIRWIGLAWAFHNPWRAVDAPFWSRAAHLLGYSAGQSSGVAAKERTRG